MILVDANLLLYAYDRLAPHHEAARGWWEECLSSPSPVCLAHVTILAFLRIATHSRLQNPMTMTRATEIVEQWLARPMVRIVRPSERHWDILKPLLVQDQVAGNLVMDAYLAALSIEHGAVLHTNDRDFRRFQGLKLAYPLQG